MVVETGHTQVKMSRDGVAGAVQPHGHFNQLIMHEGQIKSDGQCCYRRRDAQSC